MIQVFLEQDLKDLRTDIVNSLHYYESLIKTKYRKGEDNEKTDKIIEETGKFMTDMRKSIRPKILKMITEMEWGKPLENSSLDNRIKRVLSLILKLIDNSQYPEDYARITLHIDLTLVSFLPRK